VHDLSISFPKKGKLKAKKIPPPEFNVSWKNIPLI